MGLGGDYLLDTADFHREVDDDRAGDINADPGTDVDVVEGVKDKDVHPGELLKSRDLNLEAKLIS